MWVVTREGRGRGGGGAARGGLGMKNEKVMCHVMAPYRKFESQLQLHIYDLVSGGGGAVA